jgi:hypothetical protein
MKNIIEKLQDKSRIVFDEMQIDYVAGGALTSIYSGKEINDFDLYFRCKENLLITLNLMKDHVTFIGMTDRSITCVSGCGSHRSIYQLMHFNYYPDAESIFKDFDFTICMAALDVKNDDLITHKDFLYDIAARRLVLAGNTAYPFATLCRTKKYEERGYTITKQELLKLAFLCSKLNLETWEDLKIALAGYYGFEIKIDAIVEKEFTLENALEVLSSAIIKDSYDFETITFEKIIERINGDVTTTA